MRREERKPVIKVFTLKNCPKCPQAKRISQKVAEKLGIECLEVDLETPDGEIEGLMHQVMSTPSIAIGEDVISRGEVISERELEDEAKKRMADSNP